jgi:adenine-specific DNA-methyltransferase
MAQSKKDARREIAHYAHADKERLNNPPVGLVTLDTDRDAGKKTYTYDPPLDPQLVWARLSGVF